MKRSLAPLHSFTPSRENAYCTYLLHAKQGVELHRPRDVRRADGRVVPDGRLKNAFQRWHRRDQLCHGGHYSLDVAGVVQKCLPSEASGAQENKENILTRSKRVWLGDSRARVVISPRSPRKGQKRTMFVQESTHFFDRTPKDTLPRNRWYQYVG